jgi:predicted esterase
MARCEIRRELRRSQHRESSLTLSTDTSRGCLILVPACYAKRMSAARAHALRFYGAVTIGMLAVIVGTVLGRRFREPDSAVAAPRSLVADVADWCPEGLEPITGGCFAPAVATARPHGLLIYLHGRYAPESVNEERERQMRVARLGTARGYAVLALRGLQGQCTDPELATWWCWPSNERNVADGKAFVTRFEGALAEAERRAGKGRRLLLGFSNGGYFAALIAPRALLALDAVAIAHGGPVEPMRPVGQKPPLLLIDADDDPSGPEMDRLEAALTRESWPHAMVAREGGHALPDWDVEMALAFFDRTRIEQLPLSPPLAARARRLAPPPDAAGLPDEPQAAAPPAEEAAAPPALPASTESPTPATATDPAPSE